MKERDMDSEKSKTLDEALFAAWCDMEAVKKDKNNPAFRSKYADINAVQDVTVPALQKHGVRMSQAPIDGAETNRAYLKTRFSKDGEAEEFISSCPIAKNDPQGIGSAISYLRRYAQVSYFSLMTEDDDGNAASGVGVARPAPPQAAPRPIAAPPASGVPNDGKVFGPDAIKPSATPASRPMPRR